MNELSENSLWELLLLIRDFLKRKDASISEITAFYHEGHFTLLDYTPSQIHKDSRGIIISNRLPAKEYPGITAFRFNNEMDFSVVFDHFLGNDNCRILSLYLPVCFLAVLAVQRQRTVTVLHLAQTLDGRIATPSGNSKWIGDTYNLKHAHRMRALCDAVLIGSNTLRTDKPRLNVRHVQGPNPVKVVIGNKSVEFKSLQKDGGKIMYLTPAKKNGYSKIEHIRMNATADQIAPTLILKELFKHNISTLYVEGGSITASGFLIDHAVDFMQLYIAPKIFGSGITNFTLPAISQVENSVSFRSSSFVPMGEGILFSGSLQQ